MLTGIILVGCNSNCRDNFKNVYLCANQNYKKKNDMTREEFLSIADGY
jgi:hypothetical protein